jgi:hypothetical protein
MSTALTRSYVAVTYLLGARGNTLVERLPPTVAEIEGALIRGLASFERDVRARRLALSVRDLTLELEQRDLGLKTQ